MARDRRRDAATAATGASLLGAGGALRHGGVHVAYPKVKPRIHAIGMLRAAKGKKLFWGGSALGALGLPPLAVGTTHLVRGDVQKSQYVGGDYTPATELYRSRFSGDDPEHRVEYQRRYLERLRRDRHRDADFRQRVGLPAAQIANRGHTPLGSNRRLAPEPEFHGPVARSSSNKRVFYDPSVGRHHRARLEPQVGRHPLRVPVTVAISDRANESRGVAYPAPKRQHRRVELSRQLWEREHGRVATKRRSHVLHHELAHANRTGSQFRAGMGGSFMLGLATSAQREEGRADAIASQHSPYRRNSYSGLTDYRGKNLFKETRDHVLGRLARVRKADDRRGFWREGLGGTKDALKQRAESSFQPVPAKLRAAQFGAGGAAGALGSLAARAALGRRGNALKPFLTPVAGGLAATASVPVSNRIVRRKYPGYEVTPTGVRRRKTDRKLPSSKSSRYAPSQRSFRQDVGKADHKRYLGARTPYVRQRAVVTAAGHPPVIGPFTSAAAAARYAPPGHRSKAAARQWGLGTGLGVATGVAGAYGGAHLSQHSKTAEGIANDVHRAKNALESRARRAVGLKEGRQNRHVAEATRKLLATRAGAPFRSKAGAVGGAAGFLGAKMATGGIGGQYAITLNQRDQKRYNARHHIEKAVGQTKRDKEVLAQRKRHSAALQVVGGSLGLGSLGLIAAGKRHRAVTLGTIGSGLGGVNALIGARVQRQEAQHLDPVKKSDAIAIQGTRKEHREMLARYGDRGPLPKDLDRNTRMKAYEARYVHHGGQKQNHWARRADAAEGAKNIGTGVATAGVTGWLATRHLKSAKGLVHRFPKSAHTLESVAGAGAALSGIGEIAAGVAHRKQSSYANSPGGVAASALRRMRSNTPEGS